MTNHLVSAADLTPNRLKYVLHATDELKIMHGGFGLPANLTDKLIIKLFYGGSARTEMSFDAAAHYLGATVIGTSSAENFSSSFEGGTLEDAIRMCQAYTAMAIVLKHPEAGTAIRAAEISQTPIINAGDGNNEHPTQAAGDLYTIIERTNPQLSGVKIGVVGSVDNSSSAHSLLDLLANYPTCRVYVAAPRDQSPRREIVTKLREAKVALTYVPNLDGLPDDLDVIYLLQTINTNGTESQFHVSAATLERFPKAVVLHPLPRGKELPDGLMNNARVLCYAQGTNALYMRMACLQMIAEGK